MKKEIMREFSPTLKETISSWVCDTEDDVNSLPKCTCGSSAIVVSTGDVYMVNASGKWVKVGG